MPTSRLSAGSGNTFLVLLLDFTHHKLKNTSIPTLETKVRFSKCISRILLYLTSREILVLWHGSREVLGHPQGGATLMEKAWKRKKIYPMEKTHTWVPKAFFDAQESRKWNTSIPMVWDDRFFQEGRLFLIELYSDIIQWHIYQMKLWKQI